MGRNKTLSASNRPARKFRGRKKSNRTKTPKTTKILRSDAISGSYSPLPNYLKVRADGTVLWLSYEYPYMRKAVYGPFKNLAEAKQVAFIQDRIPKNSWREVDEIER